MRLLESALHVFAKKGVDAAVIDDVIAHAGVSRGSFYNYYQTNDELMDDLRTQVGNELLTLVEDTIGNRSDPSERIALAIRSVLHVAMVSPLLAQFASKAGIESMIKNSLVLDFMPRDIFASIEAGKLNVSDATIAFDFVLGITLAAFFAISVRPLQPNYPEEVVHHLLLGLGMTKASARRLSSLALPVLEIPPSMLLAKVV